MTMQPGIGTSSFMSDPEGEPPKLNKTHTEAIKEVPQESEIDRAEKVDDSEVKKDAESPDQDQNNPKTEE